MGSLFDELKKAKILDEKRAKQLAHEARVERKQGEGNEARDAELEHKAADFARQRADEKQLNRERERVRQEKAKERERLAEVRQLVAARALGDDAQGPRRWHFETSAGYLPFLPVNEMTARRLQAGELAIVADPNASWPRYVIVPRDVGLALKRVDGERVRYLAGA
jgi:uncharacterized protein YaiL (DUF2058 family)